MQRLLLYDPKRDCPDWVALVKPEQYVLFLSDAETKAPVEPDGNAVRSAAEHFCLVFDSLGGAESYGRERTAMLPRLRCEIFDSEGRVNSPVSVIVSPQFEHTLDTEKSGQRLMRIGYVLLACSPLFFLYAWHSGAGVVWWPIWVGINLVFAGLRVLQWGHGVKEELRYQRTEAKRRLDSRVAKKVAGA